jgi:hypothetical protein
MRTSAHRSQLGKAGLERSHQRVDLLSLRRPSSKRQASEFAHFLRAHGCVLLLAVAAARSRDDEAGRRIVKAVRDDFQGRVASAGFALDRFLVRYHDEQRSTRWARATHRCPRAGGLAVALQGRGTQHED